MATTVKLGSDEVYLYGEPVITSSWIRPSDWLTLPTPASEEFVGLLAVYDCDSNFVALSSSGSYTVDWGDTVIENYSSSQTAYHTHSYDSLATESYCSRGYRQAIVRVTPQTASQFVKLDLQRKHFRAGLPTQNLTPWLDIAISGSNLTGSTALVISSATTTYLRHLEQFKLADNITKIGRTAFAYMFDSTCNALQSIQLCPTISGSDFSYMFRFCYLLESIPYIDTSNCNSSMQAMFQYCNNLLSVPSLITDNVTNMAQMFGYCYNLRTIPQLNATKCGAFDNMFYNCYNLRYIPTTFCNISASTLPSYFYSAITIKSIPIFTSSVSLKSLQNFYYGCSLVDNLPYFDTSNVTNFSYAFISLYNVKSIPNYNFQSASQFIQSFQACTSLYEIPTINTSTCTNLTSLVQNCYNLRSIPLIDTTNVVTGSSLFSGCSNLVAIPALTASNLRLATTMFSNCYSLQRNQMSGSRCTLDYSSCAFSSASLVEIFNNLGTAITSGSTSITCSLNPGTSDLTAAHIAIANAKGYHVKTT